METMKSQKILVSLVAAFALVLLTLSSVSAASFGSITSVEVNGIEGLAGSSIAAFDGQTLSVRVVFAASSNSSNVRVKAWISGQQDLSVSSERFDMLSGNLYSRLMTLQMPSNIKPSEDFKLQVSVESRNDGVSDEETVNLTGQRGSYDIQVLDVITTSTAAKAGDKLAFDIVLKNRGRQFADDAFVKLRIPSLGIEEKAYFGDLSPVDQSNPNKEDAAERRMWVSIPADAPAGVYSVEAEASNADSVARLSKKISILGASEDTGVVSPMFSKTFGVGETATYTLTLVNSGSKIRAYELVFETPSGLRVDADNTVVVIPAGSSKTVQLNVVASKAGKYSFTADVNSDGALFKQQTYSANVEGGFAGSAAVLLTVVLAIIFVVLLVVLIVLLTRKPENTEEFEESYY